MSAVSPSVLLETRESGDNELNAGHTLMVAWITWFVMLTIPFLAFLGVMFHQIYGEGQVAAESTIRKWFVGSMIFCAVAVPLAFFIQGKVFKGYWKGQPVAPRDYLRGMFVIWLALELSGLVALLGCWMTGTMIPTMLPALVAFMLFVMFWPNGHAMTRPLVSEHDGADYEEPR